MSRLRPDAEEIFIQRSARTLARRTFTGLVAVACFAAACSSGKRSWLPVVPQCPDIVLGTTDIDPTISPDGSSIAYVHSATGIQVVDRLSGVSTLLAPGFFPTDRELTWSPDGSRIAYYEGDLFTVDVASGRTKRWTASAPYSHWPSWSPDGRFILYFITGRAAAAPESTAGYHIIDTFDGTQRSFVRDPYLARLAAGDRVSWSPDGRTIAFFAFLDRPVDLENAHSDLVLIDADGRSWRRLLTTPGWSENPHWMPDGHTILFDFTPPPCQPGTTTRTTTWAADTNDASLRAWPVNLGDPRVQFAYPVDISRDGTFCAYTGMDSTGHPTVIWTKSLDGSNRKQITGR